MQPKTTDELEVLFRTSHLLALLPNNHELPDDNMVDKFIHKLKMDIRLRTIEYRLSMHMQQQGPSPPSQLVESYNECQRCREINGVLQLRYERLAGSVVSRYARDDGDPIWPVHHFQRTRQELQGIADVGERIRYIDHLMQRLQGAVDTLARCAQHRNSTRQFLEDITDYECREVSIYEQTIGREILGEMLIKLLGHERTLLLGHILT